MSTTDAAFLWETEARRDSGRAAASPETAPGPSVPSAGDDGETEWVTLRDAHRATGIPVETLRKWARRGSVPSFIDDNVRGTRRMISMAAVMSRAAELGRDVAPVADTVIDLTHDARPEPQDLAAADVVDGATADHTAEPAPEPADPGELPETDGTMIVPIAAWDKMLMQLGNLHEAGQQLADARERAAKAETENRFLRERLAELRETAPRSGGTPASSEADDSPSLRGERLSPRRGTDESATRRVMRSLRRWRIEVRRR